MKLKHLLLAVTTASLALSASAANPNATVSQVRIYINPGHGSFTGSDRPMSTIKHGNQTSTNVSSDTSSFFESNTNLQKGFGLLEKLVEYGVPFDRSKNQNNSNVARRGAALDMSNNIVMSHVKCGGVDGGDYNRNLTTIAAEVEANNFDMFLSIHSNASTGDHNVPTHINQLLFLYRGKDGNEYVSGSSNMAKKCWVHATSNKHMNYNWLSNPNQPRNTESYSDNRYGYYPSGKDANGYPYWIKGDITFTPGWDSYTNNSYSGVSYRGSYGVMKHGVPGFLVEGYDHTYQPAMHRALNDDVARHEGEMYAKGINDYFGWGKTDSYGKIYGIVRDHSVTMNHPFYQVTRSNTVDANTSINQTDNKKPINHVTVELYNSSGALVDSYLTDDEWNGAYMFKKVAPGSYTIKHSRVGYGEVTQSVTVTANQTNYLNIDMRTVADGTAVQGHYAYGLKLTKVDDATYTASFKSTGAMSNGKIILTNSSTKEQTIIETGSIKKGDNSITIDAKKLDADINYTWAVAFDNPESKGYKQIFNNTSVASSSTRVGVAIDNEETSANFGTIYTITGSKLGVQKFNPDFSVNGSKFMANYFNYPRIETNSGKLYVVNNDGTNPGVWVYNPSGSTTPTQVLSTQACGVAFSGTGSSRKMYLSGKKFAYGYNIGTADSWSGGASTTFSALGTLLVNGDGDIYATDNAIIASQIRYSPNNVIDVPSFAVSDLSRNIKFNSKELNTEATDGSSLEGSNGGGFAFSKDKSIFAIQEGATNNTSIEAPVKIYSVKWNGSTPTFIYHYTITLSGTYAVDQMAFDHADNLYIASRQKGLLVYAIKTPARQTVTNGSGTIKGAKSPLYLVGNSNAVGNWDPYKAVEFTNNGQNYTITLDETVTEFKISNIKSEASGDWTEFDKGIHSADAAITNGGTVTLSHKNGSNIVLPWAGVWNITVAGDLSTLTATTSTPRPLYIVGNTEELGAWDTEKAIKVAHDGKNYNITLDENVTAFKISTSKGDEATFNNGNLAISEAITNGETVNLVANKDGGNIVLPWDGVWNIIISNDLSKLTASTETPKPLTPLYIVGNTEELGAWNTENAVEVSNNRINYSITLDESVTEFKISTNKGDETTFNNGNLAVSNPISNGVNVNLIADAEGSKIALPWAGVWNITIAGDLSTLTATTSTPRPLGSLYIVGGSYAIGDWDPSKAVEIGNDGENYTITIKAPATEFKLSTKRGGWSEFDAGNLTTNEAITNGGTINLIAQHSYNNFILPWEGEWDITISRDLSTLTASTTTPNPYEGPGIGPEPENAPNPDAEPGETPEGEDPEAAQTEGYFAYDLQSSKSGNNYIFKFKSTGAKNNGYIVLTNKSTGVKTEIRTKIIKGDNTVTINAYDILKGDYTWAVKINNKANSEVTQIASNNSITYYGNSNNARIGVAIDNDQTSANFGTIYTLTAMGQGLQKFNPDLSTNGGKLITGKFGKDTDASTSPYKFYRSNRIEVEDGKVYIANYANYNTGMWEYDPVTNASPRNITNVYYERGLAFYGEGSSRKVFSTHENNLQRFDIGTSTSWTSGSPAKKYTTAGIMDNGDGDILVTNNAVIVSQNRYAGNNQSVAPAFAVFDHNLNLISKSHVINNTLNGSSNGGMAITSDYKTFAIIDGYNESSPGDLKVQVYSVSWNGSTPTFTHQYSFALSGTRQVDQMEFDHAGNLYIASREKGLLKWAVKTSDRVTTTNARSEYTITGLANTAPTNVVATRKCYSEGSNNTAGTVDAEITWKGEAGQYRIYYQTMRRDASGNRVEDNSTWQLAGTANIASGATTGKYTHQNLAHGSDYARIYNYKVVNYYSSANHEGLSKSISGKGRTVTSYPPQVPVNVAFTQSSVEVDGVTQYTLDPQLNISLNPEVFNASLRDDNDELVKATKYVVVVDAATAKILNRASNVEEVGRFYCGPATMTANNCNHFGINDWYMVVDFDDVTPSGDLSKATKSLVWKDVDFDYTYKAQVYTSAVRTFNFTDVALSKQIEFPTPQWSANNATVGDNGELNHIADVIPVKGDQISTIVGTEDYPMGTFRKVGDTENATNPVSITKANVIGVTGVIEPLPATDEIMNEWDITYTFMVKDAQGNVISTLPQESKNNTTDANLYSNTKKVMVDVLGLPVGSDQSTAPDGRTRYTYNAEKNADYKLVVQTTYSRVVAGETESYSNETETDIVVDPVFPNPEIDPNNSPGYIFLETGTHWDADCASNGGYYKYYYDAAMDIAWSNFNDNLVRYMGYYANPKRDCVGHTVAGSSEWVPYLAASVLTDDQVTSYNSRLGSAQKPLTGIGYTGNNEWSTLSASARHIPVKVHYVWAGNEKLASDAISESNFNWELSANYPVVVYNTPLLKINSTPQDGGAYDITEPVVFARSVPGYDMQVITATNQNNKELQMDAAIENKVTTGVDGVNPENGKVIVYPNPATDFVTIKSPFAIEDVKILSSSGLLVKEIDADGTQLRVDVSDLAPGIYVVRIADQSQILIKK